MKYNFDKDYARSILMSYTTNKLRKLISDLESGVEDGRLDYHGVYPKLSKVCSKLEKLTKKENP